MNQYYPFVNTPLPYNYDAMKPFIDAKTMILHHDRHLQTYIDNLNNILKDYPILQKYSLEELLYNVDSLPSNIQIPILNNAGGVFNHRFYFDGLSRSKTKIPSGRLLNAINQGFGSLDKFIEQFQKAALSVFGSGYAWLVVNEDGKLVIVTTPNQNCPLSDGYCPVLNIDVWEHAYYLKHYNKRIDYINDWFHIINWKMAEANYNMCKQVY